MEAKIMSGIINCVVCSNPIKGEYFYDEWGNKAHATHTIKYCSSCNQMITPSSTGGGVQHPDNRTICRKCYNKSVRNETQVNQAFYQVVDLLNSVGFTDLHDDIPVHLVDKVEMKSLSGSSESLGLAKITKCGVGNKNKVTTCMIYILDYLPLVCFKGVLAHELLHVWVANRNIKLGNYEEALCNIGSTLVYNTNKNQYLSDYLNERMKKNSDLDYGIRFMKLKNKLKQLGWEAFIKEIKKKS